MGVVVRRAEVSAFGAADRLVDLRLDAGVVAALGPTLPSRRGDEELDAGGGTALPGLHDHHIHLRALAMARASVGVGPPEVADLVALGRRLGEATAATPPGEWIRAVGYHESVAGDLDRTALDRLCPSHPVRVQHASGALWIVNTAGLAALGADGTAPPGVERDRDGRPTGRIWREDQWIAERAPAEPPDLGAVSRDAAARGVTGFTDATPGRGDLEVGALGDLVGSGAIVQRLHLMAMAGTRPSPEPLVTLGPVKVMLDDSTLPSLDDLSAIVVEAHRSGRPVAVHCVTRVQAVLAVAAISHAGPLDGDRIEHGAVIGPDMLPVLRQLGVTVVTQPAMVAARADRYLADVDADDLPDLWRAASLIAAGVTLAGGSDAPYGPPDPWRVVADATERRSPGGSVLGPEERLAPARALRLLTGWAERPATSRTVAVGQPADLCILDGRLDLADIANPPPVAATVVAGRVVHRAG